MIQSKKMIRVSSLVIVVIYSLRPLTIESRSAIVPIRLNWRLSKGVKNLECAKLTRFLTLSGKKSVKVANLEREVKSLAILVEISVILVKELLVVSGTTVLRPKIFS